MFVNGSWQVTNITDRPIRLIRAELKGRNVQNSMMMVEGPPGYVYGDNPIPPWSTREVAVHFWVEPPTEEPGHDLRATVIFFDQFNNRHAIRNVRFRSLRPNPQPAQRTDPPPEALYTIADPIEKDVAAILKDELDRYASYGRRIGALGSVHVVYRGQQLPGFGADWRTETPVRQSIAPDPQAATVRSDNLDALVRRYSQLTTGGERERFVGALLARLHRDKEYAPVGYLIVVALFRIGRLTDALDGAARNLQGDTGLGFSEVLRLLDGLLRFVHPDLTEESLDAVERFARGPEYPESANIPRRVAAIRALRVGHSAAQTPGPASG